MKLMMKLGGTDAVWMAITLNKIVILPDHNKSTIELSDAGVAGNKWNLRIRRGLYLQLMGENVVTIEEEI